MAINESRPELLSIIFALFAALIIFKGDTARYRSSQVTPVLFGISIGLSILSKIQVLPLVASLLFLYALNLMQVVNRNQITKNRLVILFYKTITE